MKTAEEILSKYTQAQSKFDSIIKYTLGDVLQAMDENLSEYKKSLKERLPTEENIDEEYPLTFFSGVVDMDIPNANRTRAVSKQMLNRIKNLIDSK